MKPFLKDSIITANQPLADITNNILSNISSLSYEDLKANTLQLPMEQYNRYLSTVINATCENQPEFFYRLVNDLPIEHFWLFNFIKRKARKKIRSTKTTSPFKREYIHHHRSEVLTSAGAITGVITLVALEVGAITWGIVALVKKR